MTFFLLTFILIFLQHACALQQIDYPPINSGSIFIIESTKHQNVHPGNLTSPEYRKLVVNGGGRPYLGVFYEYSRVCYAIHDFRFDNEKAMLNYFKDLTTITATVDADAAMANNYKRLLDGKHHKIELGETDAYLEFGMLHRLRAVMLCTREGGDYSERYIELVKELRSDIINRLNWATYSDSYIDLIKSQFEIADKPTVHSGSGALAKLKNRADVSELAGPQFVGHVKTSDEHSKKEARKQTPYWHLTNLVSSYTFASYLLLPLIAYGIDVEKRITIEMLIWDYCVVGFLLIVASVVYWRILKAPYSKICTTLESFTGKQFVRSHYNTGFLVMVLAYANVWDVTGKMVICYFLLPFAVPLFVLARFAIHIEDTPVESWLTQALYMCSPFDGQAYMRYHLYEATLPYRKDGIRFSYHMVGSGTRCYKQLGLREENDPHTLTIDALKNKVKDISQPIWEKKTIVFGLIKQEKGVNFLHCSTYINEREFTEDEIKVRKDVLEIVVDAYTHILSHGTEIGGMSYVNVKYDKSQTITVGEITAMSIDMVEDKGKRVVLANKELVEKSLPITLVSLVNRTDKAFSDCYEDRVCMMEEKYLILPCRDARKLELLLRKLTIGIRGSSDRGTSYTRLFKLDNRSIVSRTMGHLKAYPTVRAFVEYVIENQFEDVLITNLSSMSLNVITFGNIIYIGTDADIDFTEMWVTSTFENLKDGEIYHNYVFG